MTDTNLTEVQALREAYSTDPRQSSFNILVLGEMGSGKTFLFRTARFPVHIDSFDPGGTKGLKEWISTGDIVVDSQYESEDRMKPWAFAKWEANFERRVKSGYFDQFGTYLIDSASSFSDAIMNSILKKSNIAGSPPRYTKDYTPQKTLIHNYLRLMLDLPCDFAMTGHLEPYTSGEETMFRFLVTGKGAIIFPTLFDEVYIMLPKTIGQKTAYRLLTQNTGTYLARSRLAANGKLDMYEDPDIKNLLKKAGLSTDDKPKLGMAPPAVQEPKGA